MPGACEFSTVCGCSEVRSTTNSGGGVYAMPLKPPYSLNAMNPSPSRATARPCTSGQAWHISISINSKRV